MTARRSLPNHSGKVKLYSYKVVLNQRHTYFGTEGLYKVNRIVALPSYTRLLTMFWASAGHPPRHSIFHLRHVAPPASPLFSQRTQRRAVIKSTGHNSYGFAKAPIDFICHLSVSLPVHLIFGGLRGLSTTTGWLSGKFSCAGWLSSPTNHRNGLFDYEDRPAIGGRCQVFNFREASKNQFQHQQARGRR